MSTMIRRTLGNPTATDGYGHGHNSIHAIDAADFARSPEATRPGTGVVAVSQRTWLSGAKHCSWQFLTELLWSKHIRQEITEQPGKANGV